MVERTEIIEAAQTRETITNSTHEEWQPSEEGREGTNAHRRV